MAMTIEWLIKDLAHRLGADLCGIAPVERFRDAPQGFHPQDIFPEAKAVVVVAKRFLEGPLHCVSAIPYTTASDVILAQVTRIVVLLCSAIEQRIGAQAVPIPSEPYEYWDANRREGKGLLSLKHAGWLAGLGVITRNSLLTNKDYGNRICLGAALVDIDLVADEMPAYNFDCEHCRLCVESCPARAISGRVVNQSLCRGRCEGKTAKGYPLYVCNVCRRICPNGAGRRNGHSVPSVPATNGSQGQ
jgi:epoxyqueuosine reductase